MSYQVGPQQPFVLTDRAEFDALMRHKDARGCGGDYMDFYPLLDGDGRPVAYVMDEFLAHLFALADEINEESGHLVRAHDMDYLLGSLGDLAALLERLDVESNRIARAGGTSQPPITSGAEQTDVFRC